MTEQPEPAVDLEEHAGLFGAAPAGAGRWTPDLVVSLFGTELAAGPAGPGPVVVDGVTVTWGRQDVMDQPDLSTARLTLFDPTAVWAIGTELMGQPVTLTFRGTPPSTAGAQAGVSGTSFSRPFFFGRVQSVDIVPKTIRNPDGSSTYGALVNLTLVSILNDLANRVPLEAWPAETLGARCDRIETAAADVLPGSVIMRDYWKTPQVAPVAAADQVSIYDHLLSVFDSCGCDRLTHYPNIGRVEYLARREYAESYRGLGQLWWEVTGSGTAEAAKGVYARTRVAFSEDANVNAELFPAYLDGGHVQYDRGEGLTRGPSSGITRVEVAHPDSGAAYAMTAGQVIVADEALVGVRTARIESIVAWNAWADLACEDLADYVLKEGAAWGTGPLRFSTRRAGGFANLAQAIWMLSAAEIPTIVFVQGSQLTRYGVSPIVGLMGGTITFTDGGWDVELHTAPVITRAAQHPLTWAEIDDGTPGFEVQWHDATHVRGLHDSLTFEDLAWVARGLNVTTTGPDQGWDFYA